MEKILIFIKHHFNFIWKIIEWGNGIAFSLFYKRKVKIILPEVFKEYSLPIFICRPLNHLDAKSLFDLIALQESSDLKFFHPHSFDLNSIIKQFNNRSFLMMGVFENEKIIGYFFLRFFANKKCFVGRLIDKEYRGIGIGSIMNHIMYEISWRMGFRCLSTISKNNKAVIRAHAKNPTMVVLKELANDYILVEFTRNAETSGGIADSLNTKNLA